MIDPNRAARRCALLLALPTCWVTPATADETRVALVIGNKDYTEAPLKNPVNDARDMKAALERLGFSVVYRENATLEQMDSAMREFTRKLDPETIALFYYSGHGLQADGVNYLVPVGASIASKAEVKSRAYDAGIALGNMEEAGVRVSMVVLDACRDVPFRSYRSSAGGLAQMGGGSSSIIAFATAPGSTAQDGDGRNGTFTKHLLSHIAQPGISAIEALQQVQTGVADETDDGQKPWVNFGPQRGQFCFSGCSSAKAEAPPAPPPALPVTMAADASQVELAFWNSIADSTDPADFRAYLAKYPQGQFQELARNRIERIKGAARPLPKAPAAMPEFDANAYVCKLDPHGDNFLSLRTGPKGSYPEVLRLTSRTRLAVLQTKGAWLQVRLRDGTTGWVFGQWVCR